MPRSWPETKVQKRPAFRSDFRHTYRRAVFPRPFVASFHKSQICLVFLWQILVCSIDDRGQDHTSAVPTNKQMKRDQNWKYINSIQLQSGKVSIIFLYSSLWKINRLSWRREDNWSQITLSAQRPKYFKRSRGIFIKPTLSPIRAIVLQHAKKYFRIHRTHKYYYIN